MKPIHACPGVAHALGRRPEVLVVEDNQDLGRELSAALEDHGFQVTWVATGHNGLQHALNRNVDAVVLDRMLPDIDGLSVLATLRHLGKQTPVLILSALAAVDERVRGLRAGGDDYLIKPFDSLELTARLNALLRRRSLSASPSLLSVGDLTLDAGAHRVQRAGETIELKPREYSLLECMMRHAGNMVTRAMLLESVWNYHFNAHTNVIDAHICNLRRKVTLNGRMPSMIHTVRNVGYLLHAAD